MTGTPPKPPSQVLADLMAGKVFGPPRLTKIVKEVRADAVENRDESVREALRDKVFK